MQEQKVTPFEVSSHKKINYEKLLKDFGCEKITEETLEKFKKCIPNSISINEHSELSHLLSRRIYYASRDLENVFKNISNSYLYTGRGPSSGSIHLGHSIPFLMNKYLQDTYNLPLVIMISDDEKFLSKSESLDSISSFTKENIKDIIAFDFNPSKTFIFTNFSYISNLYPTVCSISRNLKLSILKQCFGFEDSSNVGICHYTAVQAAACFPSSFPDILDKNKKCLIPCAIDQDPYFRLTRDVASKLKYSKPSTLYSEFLPPLDGTGKMSSSATNKSKVIFMNDDKETVEKKIKKYMFSGARKTMEEHRKFGADVENDVACQYLRFFMKDEEKMKKIIEDYKNGKVGTGFVKENLAKEINDMLGKYQERRSKITEEEVKEFMRIRKLD